MSQENMAFFNQAVSKNPSNYETRFGIQTGSTFVKRNNKKESLVRQSVESFDSQDSEEEEETALRTRVHQSI